MTETKNLAFKILDRLISWFFLFVILFSTLGIVLTASGFSKTYLFVSPLAMSLASGILSCFFTFCFTKKELKKEPNRQMRTV